MPPSFEPGQLWSNGSPFVLTHVTPTVLTFAALANGRRIRQPPSRMTGWRQISAEHEGEGTCFMEGCPTRAFHTFAVPDHADPDRHSFDQPALVEPTRRFTCLRHIPAGPSFHPGIARTSPIAYGRLNFGLSPLPLCPLCNQATVWNTTWRLPGAVCVQCTTCDYTYHTVTTGTLATLFPAFPDDLAMRVWLPEGVFLEPLREEVETLRPSATALVGRDGRVLIGLHRSQAPALDLPPASDLRGRVVETDQGEYVGSIVSLTPGGLGSFYGKGKVMDSPLVLPGTLWTQRQGRTVARITRVERPNVRFSVDGGAPVGLSLDEFLALYVPVRLTPTKAPGRALSPIPGEEWVHRGDSALFFLVASVQPQKDWIILYADGHPSQAQAGRLSDFLRDSRWERYIRPTVYQHLLDEDD